MNETYSFGRSKRRSGPVPSQRDDQARGEPAAMPRAVGHRRPPPRRARGGDAHQFASPATLNHRTSSLSERTHSHTNAKNAHKHTRTCTGATADVNNPREHACTQHGRANAIADMHIPRSTVSSVVANGICLPVAGSWIPRTVHMSHTLRRCTVLLVARRNMPAPALANHITSARAPTRLNVQRVKTHARGRRRGCAAAHGACLVPYSHPNANASAGSSARSRVEDWDPPISSAPLRYRSTCHAEKFQNQSERAVALADCECANGAVTESMRE